MVKIVDLEKQYEPLYHVCLEDWSDEMKEAGDHKARWITKMKENGLRVKLALDEAGEVCGMVEYLPIDQSIADGQNLMYINCIWVHAHKKGIGDKRKQGYGKALLAAAEDDSRASGAVGMAAYGLTMPFWIPASFFKKQGYVRADKEGIGVLLFKPFGADARPPKMIRQKKTPEKNQNPGAVTVTFFLSGYCPGRNIVFERTKRAVESFDGKAVFIAVDTSDRETYLEWGMRDELFIEDKQVRYGPPLSYEKVKKRIAKQVRKLAR